MDGRFVPYRDSKTGFFTPTGLDKYMSRRYERVSVPTEDFYFYHMNPSPDHIFIIDNQPFLPLDINGLIIINKNRQPWFYISGIINWKMTAFLPMFIVAYQFLLTSGLSHSALGLSRKRKADFSNVVIRELIGLGCDNPDKETNKLFKAEQWGLNGFYMTAFRQLQGLICLCSSLNTIVSRARRTIRVTILINNKDLAAYGSMFLAFAASGFGKAFMLAFDRILRMWRE